MYHFEWEIIALAVICEILGTVSGLGSSIFFLPLAQYFENPHTVMVLTAILHVFANGSRVYLFWDKDTLSLLKKYVPIYISTTAIGAILSIYTEPTYYKLALGILLILFVPFHWMYSGRRFFKSNRSQKVLIGFSGVTTGWVGTGGAIREMALLALYLNKNQFVFMSSAIDIGGDVLRSGIYLANGYLKIEHVLYIPILAVCGWIGTRIGKYLLTKVPQRTFELVILVAIFLIGLASVYDFVV